MIIFNFIGKPYNVRNSVIILKRANHTPCFGTETVSSLAPKIWDIILLGAN